MAWRMARRRMAKFKCLMTSCLMCGCLLLFLHFRLPKDSILKINSLESQFSSPDTIEDIFQNRKLSAHQACESHWALNLGTNVSAWSIFYDSGMSMVYCHVAKAGCTFWARVFNFLNQTEWSRKFKSPFDIKRIDVHNRSLTPIRTWTEVKPQLPETSKKFLFARDPYARLWSVYLDKYYLPDFWERLEFSSNICHNNVTFTQFLSFAMTSDDNHMSTVAAACNPCEFNPDFIGKMETFSRDALEILKRFNYSWLLDGLDFVNFTVIEIQSILSNYYQLYRDNSLHKCLSQKDLSRRLWKVFQTNGHIRPTFLFPEDLDDYSEHTILTILTNSVRSNPLREEEAIKQKRSHLVEAYSGVPVEYIKAIQEKFRVDFEMFNYDVNPPKSINVDVF